MAGDIAVARFHQNRGFGAAAFVDIRAAEVKGASGRGVDGEVGSSRIAGRGGRNHLLKRRAMALRDATVRMAMRSQDP